MEYATLIDGDQCHPEKDLSLKLKSLTQTNHSSAYDDRLDMNQFVGWFTVSDWNPLVQRLFTKTTVSVIQGKTSEYLSGIQQNGKRIIPSERVVVAALYGIFKNFHPTTGDIYGKYTVTDQIGRDDYSYIVDQTISLLVQGIRDEMGMVENNQKLTIWTTLYGDFNAHGLRQFPPIKINNKRPDPMLFHMRY